MEFASAKVEKQGEEDENENENEEQPGLSRGISSTLASVCAVDRGRAREALALAGGDVDRAAMILMTGSEAFTSTSSSDISPVQELIELGGLNHSQAEEYLTAAGGDLEQAKANVLTSMGISTAPEKFSCLIHPLSLTACPVCCDTPASCTELVQLQQCNHQFCTGMYCTVLSCVLIYV
jgi:hypothetical protein